jgi:Glycosyltransferase family 87
VSEATSDTSSGWGRGLRLLAIGLTLVGLLWLALALPGLSGTSNWALDYLAYRDAALRLASEGTLYSVATTAGAFHPGPTGLYVYPPPLGVAVIPLSSISFESGAQAWYGLHVLVLALACALMPVERAIRWAAFGIAAISFAVLRDLTMGNVSVLMLLPLVAGWRWLDQPLGSIGMAIAASVRVSHGLFLIWLVLRRAWRPFVWMVASGIVIVVATLPLVGLRGYLDYLTTVRNIGDTTGVLRNSDLASTALALGVPTEFAGLALIPGFVVAVAAVVGSLRRDAEVGYMVTLSASYLLVPLLWDHYLSVLLLPAAFLASRGRRWALALPLLSWLPAEMLPFVMIVATLLPFSAQPATEPRPRTASTST